MCDIFIYYIIVYAYEYTHVYIQDIGLLLDIIRYRSSTFFRPGTPRFPKLMAKWCRDP